ncbi:MAG: HAD-IA family hydrolase [Roseiarcus sp.]|uniref:HAD-IA family hydrolase n=1 Tax=Roseiarcus sp. TaxID=1969460 RepID=UPI003C201A08
MSAAATLVFDLDGTLADTAPDLMGALNFVLTREGVAPLPVAAARRLLGAGGRALIQRGFAEAGRAIDAATLERLFVDFLAHYNAHIADGTTLYPGVVAGLDRCAAAGWRLAVCTNKMEKSSKLLLGKLGVLDRFAFVCGQDTFGIGKPDPRPFVETVRAAGGAVERAVMVGDSKTDVAIARAAGAPVICVDYGYTDVPVAELGPDRVVSHFDAVFDAAAALLDTAPEARRALTRPLGRP